MAEPGTAAPAAAPGGTGGNSAAITINSVNGSGGTATALGGAGGNGATGGTGGAGFRNPGGTGGAGGAGGNSTTYAQGPLPTGGNSLQTANGTGGAGGTGGQGGAPGTGTSHAGGGGAGGAGGSASLGELSSAGINVTLQSTLNGGIGGTGGLDGNGNLSGAGGNGGSESLFESPGDIIFGSASGTFLVNPTLIGGNGGNGGGAGGNGGNAVTNLPFTPGGSSSTGGVTINAKDYGGEGGNALGGTSGNGGSADSEVQLTFNSTVTANAFANQPFDNYFGPQGQGGAIINATGNAGFGGDAFASANAFSTSTTLGNSAANANASAFGGNGGSVANGVLGSGGYGGALAGLFAMGTGGPDGVIVQATGFTGNGGQGTGAGSSGGHAGIVMGTPMAIGVSNHGGNVSATLSVSGGVGGPGVGGASGGNGVDVMLNNQASGFTSGTLTLIQSAQGGPGGSADGATPGIAGEGDSTLDVENNNAAVESITADALGGGGGSNQNANGGKGGDATAVSNIIGSGNKLTSNANAGGNAYRGGDTVGQVLGFKGGDGGKATANATLTSSDMGTSNSFLSAGAVAVGQNGGNGLTIANGGNGGDAFSTATSTGNNAHVVAAYAEADSGQGGTGAGAGSTNGTGGNAFANAVATQNFVTSTHGEADPTAYANAGQVVNSPDNRGAAFATATGTSSTGVFSQVVGFGSSGSITAVANLLPFNPGLVSSLRGTAFASVDPASGSTARALGLYEDEEGLFGPSSGVVLMTSPPPFAVVLSPGSNAQAVFNNNASSVSVVGIAELQKKMGGSSTVQTYSTDEDLQLNSALLTSNELVLAMGTPEIDNFQTVLQAGDTVRFRIERGTTTLIDQTFTTTDAFEAALYGTVFDLGAGNSGGPANQEIQVLMDFSSAINGDSAGVQFYFGSVAPLALHWQGAADSHWNNAANWQLGAVPNGAGLSVSFTGAAAQTITLDQPTTLGSVTFNNPHSNTIAPGASNFPLNFDNAGAAANITVGQGNQTISAPVTFTSAGLTISVPTASTLFLNASLSGPGGVTFFGPGTLAFLPSSGTTKINNLTISGLGSPAPSVAGPTPDGSVVIPGSVDLTNNKLILQTDPAIPGDKSTKLSNLQLAIISALNGPSGPWTGTGITSSTLAGFAASGNHSMTLAVADNAFLHKPTFGGQPVDDNSLLVTIALNGDTNLDGSVGASDLLNLLKHYNTPDTNWTDGNSTNDPTLGSADLLALLKNYNTSLPAFSLAPAAPALASPATPVPEPASLTLALLAAPFLLKRRRARQNPASAPL